MTEVIANSPGRPKNTVRSSQYRFTVPDTDIDVIEWIEQQYSVSNSVRTLIKKFVEKHGLVDCTCLPRIKPKTPVSENIAPELKAFVKSGDIAPNAVSVLKNLTHQKQIQVIDALKRLEVGFAARNIEIIAESLLQI